MPESATTALVGLVADEATFRVVADAMPVLVWLADARGNNTYCNRAYLEFRGTSLEEELKGGWLNAIHPADQPGYAEAAGDAFREPEALRN